MEGVDENGQQLDQREFETTREALRWLATCRMARYNKTGRYQPDLVPAVERTLVHDGLPEHHGVDLRVSKDGQRWYACQDDVAAQLGGTGWLAVEPLDPAVERWHL